ncbi:hypothetical protein OC844_005106 [Tilletia horrida]|nr:hypothetical protein OC844_005106 [Tilletia horrida]
MSERIARSAQPFSSSSSSSSTSSPFPPTESTLGAIRSFSSSSSSSSSHGSSGQQHTRTTSSERDTETDFAFPGSKHERDFSLGSPSSSRFLHLGHNSLGSVGHVAGKPSQDRASGSTSPSRHMQSAAAAASGQAPRKINSRGMRLGAQLRKPGSSNGHTSEPAQPSSLAISGLSDRAEPKSSTSTFASTTDGSSGIPEESADYGIGSSSEASFPRGHSKGSSESAPDGVLSTTSTLASSRGAAVEDSSSSKAGASAQPTSTATAAAAAAAAASQPASSTNSGPTPPRPPRKLGGRVAALAAKLSGNDLASAARSPVPSPTRAVAGGPGHRQQSSGTLGSSTAAELANLSAAPRGAGTDSVASASPSIPTPGSGASPVPSASSASPAQAPGGFSPRTSSLRRHTPQSSLGSVRKLGEAVANFGASLTQGHAGSKTESRRGSSDLRRQRTISTGSDVTGLSPAGLMAAATVDGSFANRRISEDVLSQGRPSSEIGGRSSPARTSPIPPAGAPNAGLSINPSSASRSPASPPPRSPRRMKDSASRAAELSNSPSSPTPTPAAVARSAGAGGSVSSSSSGGKEANTGSASASQKDASTVRASSLASYTESVRSRSRSSVRSRSGSAEAIRAAAAMAAATAAGNQERDGEDAQKAAAAAPPTAAGAAEAEAVGDVSSSSLADSSMIVNNGMGSALESSANTSQRRSDLTVDTSLQSVSSKASSAEPSSGGTAARSGSDDSVLHSAVEKHGPSAWAGGSAHPLSANSSGWAPGTSATSSPFGAASPVLGNASTPTATSASGHSASMSQGGGASGSHQQHTKTLGRLSRLTYARNDGVSVFGLGGPHGGGKGWSDYSAPNSAAPRSPTMQGSSNGFAASFGAAVQGASGGPGSVAGSSRGGSVSIPSGANSLRASVDANGTSAGSPLGLAIAHANVSAGMNGPAASSVAGSHGLTLGLSPDLNQSAVFGVGGVTSGAAEAGPMSSPAPFKLLSAALSSARNSLPVGALRSEGRDRDLAERSHLAAVEEASVAHEGAPNGRAMGAPQEDALTGLGIEHGPGRPAAHRIAAASGPRASLPALSGLPPQRELLLPALQSVRSAFEGHDHRRDTFSFGSGSAFSGQRPLSALIDDPAPGASSSKDESQQSSSAVSSVISSGTRSASAFGWSRSGEGGPSHGRDSASPPTTGESASMASGGRMMLKEPLTGERERMKLNRKPSHPTLVEEAEQNPSVSTSSAQKSQEHSSVSTDTVVEPFLGPESTPTQNNAKSGRAESSTAGRRDSNARPAANGAAATPTEPSRVRQGPGPEDEIEGLTIQRRPDGGFTYLDANGQPLGSKTVLTLAIEKAQNAVMLDSSNQVPEAISAYKHALRLLEEVMERIAPKPGQRPKPNREEERRRLVIIHDTYADRIRLLSAIRGASSKSPHGTKASLSQQAQKAKVAPQSTFNADMIPQRPKGPAGLDQPQRSDGFHEALAAANEERRGSLRNAASADLLRTRRPSAISAERPVSLAANSGSTESETYNRSSEDQGPASASTLNSSGRVGLDDDSKRDSLATALSSHTLTPRNHLAQTAIAEKQHMPKISIQPESPESRQARLSEVPVTSEIVLGPSRSPQLPVGKLDGSQHRRTGSDGSGRSGSVSRNRRQSASTSPTRQRSIPDGLKTPTTPYFDTSSQLHMEDDSSPKPGPSRPTSEWSAAPSDGPAEKERTNTLGVGLMSPPQMLGDGDNVRLRPLSAFTESGASQAASDGHPSEAEADLDRALAGLDASLSQLSQERIYGTVRATGRRQSRASLHSTAAGGDKAAAAAMAAMSGTPGPPGRRQKTLSTTSKPDSISNRGDGSRAPTEFPRMGGAEGGPDPEAEQRAIGSSGRQRSSSQPAPKRPPIPFSFMNGGPAPPMPRLTRKGSTSSTHALSPSAAAAAMSRAGSTANSSIRPGPGGQSGFRFPSPSPSAVSTFAPSEAPMSGSAYYDENGQPRTAGAFDLFPSGLPSVQYSGVPSFATQVSNSALPGVSMDPGAHDYSQLFPMPANVIMRPFYVLRQIQTSLSNGAHLTRKLYAPKNLWDSASQQSGPAKIALLDLKVRMLDLVATGMEPVEAGGKALLQPPIISQPGLLAMQATKFARQLDEFELLLMDVQNTLAQKMGSVEPVVGKKNKNAFGSIGSKLKGSFGGLTSSNKGLDSPTDYIFSLSRLCDKLGHLDQHVQSVLRAQSGASENDMRSPGTETYAALPTEVRVSIEAKLKRTSDWLANVLLCFVLRDIALVLDRYTKRASIPFVEG